jgi:hypothetical protein
MLEKEQSENKTFIKVSSEIIVAILLPCRKEVNI